MPKSERWVAWGCKSSRVSASGCTIVEKESARGCTVNDYVVRAVAAVVAVIYLCNYKHGWDQVTDMIVLFVNNGWYHLVLLSTHRRYDYWLIAILDPTPPGLDSVSAVPHCLLCHDADYCCWCMNCCITAWLFIACGYVTCEYIIVLILAFHVARS